MPYNVHRVLSMSSFFQAKKFSLYYICSFKDRELEIGLTSGLSQTTLNRVLKTKYRQQTLKQIFYGTLTTQPIMDYYAESLVFQISLETLFCNFSFC